MRRLGGEASIMVQSFCDLEGCLSLSDVQQRLAQADLKAGPRHLTRLLALHQRGIRLSWSALEALLSEAPQALMSLHWNQLPEQRPLLEQELAALGLSLRPLGASAGMAWEVLSSDEVWMSSQEQSLVPMAVQSVSQAMVGQLGRELESWPESWRIVSDAEDSARILEHLRSAFRQLRQQGRDPGPLLWLALRRRRPEVTREVAQLVHQYVDPDIGRQLELLFSPEVSLAQQALLELRRRDGTSSDQAWDAGFLVGLLQILWENPGLQPAILELVEDRMALWVQQPSLILSWWEECLADAARVAPEVTQKLAQISLAWAGAGVDMVGLLRRRLSRALSLAERLLSAWLLGQLSLDGAAREELLVRALELACEPHLAGQGLVRVEQILSRLGQEALEKLLDPSRWQRLGEDLRCWTLEQALGGPEPLARLAQRSAIAEIVGGSRRILRLMARLQRQLKPEGQDDDLVFALVGVLEQEIPLLEEPEDRWAIAQLVQLDPEVLQRLLTQLERDAQMGSRAFPARLENWAKHCFAAGQAPPSGVLEHFLTLAPALERPEIWRSWAWLIGCPALPAAWRERLVQELCLGAQQLPEHEAFWWEIVQSSPDPQVAAEAEQSMLNQLAREQQSRAALQSLLESLERCLDRWGQPQPLIRLLSQRLLWLRSEETPQQRLRRALSRDSAGDGVLMPQLWDAQQRDLALQLLGRLSLRSELPAGLRRPLRVRCWQFLKDWLDGVWKGGDSYQHRSMPLWTSGKAMLAHIEEAEQALVDDLAENLLGLQDSYPERLRLLTHSDCLGFLLDWSLLPLGPELQSRRQRRMLTTLAQLIASSDRDYRPVAIGYLVGLDMERLHPGLRSDWRRLRQRWEGWLYGE